MCGVNAILRKDGHRADVGEITRMCAAIHHRGPDGAGYALLNRARLALGHVRLSIIDLHAGDQPIYNEDGSICIVFNGEIYDYKALRERLQDLGHAFRTQTDTEVIIHLYEEYGMDFVHELNGEFAFILWDSNTRRLIAARDRAGVKPLFYHVNHQEVLISSEVKGIFALNRVPREMNPEFFTGPLFGVFPRALSAFKHVKALPAGHFLIIDDDKVAQEVPYWQPSYQVNENISADEAQHKVRGLFSAAVCRRMVADVPVGTYLSGGLDSTLVCGLMAERTTRLKAFSIGFGQTIYDESSEAKRIAKHFGAEFETIDCNDNALAENLQKTLYHVEQPLANPNAIAKQMLSNLVRSRGYKVCLTGEGSDEIFGGYAFFKLEQIWKMLEAGGETAKQGRQLLKKFKSMEGRSEGLLWQRGNDWRKLDRRHGYASFHQMRAKQHDWVMRKLVRPEVIDAASINSPTATFNSEFDQKNLKNLDPFNATRFMTFNQLVSYIIPTLGDRVEMANSVECRTPFLDKNLIEFVQKVPTQHFMDIENLQEKHLLQKAFHGTLSGLGTTFHKHPFLSPSWHGLVHSEAGKKYVHHLVSPEMVRRAGLFNSFGFQQVAFYWNYLPRRMSLWKRVDVIMGMMLTAHALHEIFVEKPVTVSSSFDIQDRTMRPRRNQSTHAMEVS